MTSIKITFPKPLSDESWKLILEQKLAVEILIDDEKHPLKWDGSQWVEPVEMWYKIPDFIVVSKGESIDSDRKRS